MLSPAKTLVGACYVLPAEAQVWFAIGSDGAYVNGERLPCPSRRTPEPPVGVSRRPRKGQPAKIEPLYQQFEGRCQQQGWKITSGQPLSARDPLELAAHGGSGGVGYFAKIWDILAAAAVAVEAGCAASLITAGVGVPLFPLPESLQQLTQGQERAFFVIDRTIPPPGSRA